MPLASHFFRQIRREAHYMASKRPLVAVIGTTGAGKSRVGIDIALACNGEVVNADAMQVYEGLDIITNKVTQEEMRQVPHHLMGYKKPGEETYVAEWAKMASDSIDAIHAREHLPVIVGGTSYWLQSLLFTNQLVVEESGSEGRKAHPKPNSALQERLDQLSQLDLTLFENLPEEPPKGPNEGEEALRLWNILNALDPEMAARWHWRDCRKVLRSLEIIGETGEKASDIIKKQDNDQPDSRYRTLVIWPYTEKDTLNPRLDKRVDLMIEGGLLDEIKELHQISTSIVQKTGAPIEYTRGIFQSIGYKEFHEYLLEPSEHSFRAAVDAMKKATQKYAVYQTKWIRRKFLPLLLAFPDTYIYILDTTNVDNWSELERQAVEVTKAFLLNEPLPTQSSYASEASQILSAALPLSKPSSALANHKKVTCELCTREPNQPFLINANEWTSHLNSRGHRQRIKSRKKREYNLEFLRKRAMEASGDSGIGASQGDTSERIDLSSEDEKIDKT